MGRATDAPLLQRLPGAHAREFCCGSARCSALVVRTGPVAVEPDATAAPGQAPEGEGGGCPQLAPFKGIDAGVDQTGIDQRAADPPAEHPGEQKADGLEVAGHEFKSAIPILAERTEPLRVAQIQTRQRLRSLGLRCCVRAAFMALVVMLLLFALAVSEAFTIRSLKNGDCSIARLKVSI